MWRIALCTLLTIAASGAVRAQEARRSYAVLSMIGDSVTVVSQPQNVGSHLDQQRPEPVSLGPILDRTALATIRSSIATIDAQAPVALYAASPAALARDPRELFEGGQVRLAEQMIAAMREDKATHLVLLTRYRSEEPIRGTSGRGYVAGSLEGAGLYGNAQYRFNAPYVYVRLSLVSLDTLKVEREQLITANYVLSTRTGSNDDKHLPALVDLLKRELSRALPPLLTGSAPPPRN